MGKRISPAIRKPLIGGLGEKDFLMNFKMGWEKAISFYQPAKPLLALQSRRHDHDATILCRLTPTRSRREPTPWRNRMDLFIFARFHARDGQQDAVATALRDVVTPTRLEPGCRSIEAFGSTRDPRLFYIHSRWVDEAAFDTHAERHHTVRFVARVQTLIDHPLDVTRARPLP
jgi:quinol monooxygenase YgiN